MPFLPPYQQRQSTEGINYHHGLILKEAENENQDCNCPTQIHTENADHQVTVCVQIVL